VNVKELAAYAEDFGGFRAAWERALSNGFDEAELAELAWRLRSVGPQYRIERGYKIEVEPRFKLRPKEARALAVKLVRAGVPDDHRAFRHLAISRTTLWRIRREAEHPRTGGLTPLFDPSPDAGLRVSKRPTPIRGLSYHFDASSGAEDDRPLRRLLGLPR
jgi:hypothetical protein